MNRYYFKALILSIIAVSQILAQESAPPPMQQSVVVAIDAEEAQACPICLEALIHDTPETKTLDCNHEFHEACIDRWLQTNPDGSCPLCRQAINQNATTNAGCNFNSILALVALITVVGLGITGLILFLLITFNITPLFR